MSLRSLGRRLLTAGLALSLCIPAASAKEEVTPALQQQKIADLSHYVLCLVRLTRLGATAQEAQNLYHNLGPQQALALTDGDLSTQSVELLLQPNARPDRLARYLAHTQRHPDLTADQVVTQINMDADRDFYTQAETITDPADLLVLVNKHYALPDDYVPELTALPQSYGRGSLHPTAAEAFVQMADAAWADGLSLRCVSGYRSYKTQASTYRGNLAQASQRWVDTYSARPGHSEHQTGLAVDINVARTSAHFENTAEFAWLQANCARFGFILRYPEGADAITGYRFEPWHYRYVGVETAQACTQQGITYEEYTASLPAAGQASQPLPSVFPGPPEVCFPTFTPPLLPIF